MRVLFAGLGGVGQRHLRNLSKLIGPSLEVLAFRVRGESDVLDSKLRIVSGESLESKYGIVTFNELSEALGTKPQVVFITNPTSLHYDVAIPSLKSNIPIFVEKPITNSLQSARKIVELAKEKSILGMVGFQLRYHPCIKKTIEIIESGELGTITGAKFEIGEYLPNWHPYEDYTRMYASRADLGGGVVKTQIHEIDLIIAFFGMPKRVFSSGGKLSDLKIDVEDTAYTLMECEYKGQLLPIILAQDYIQRPPTRKIEVVGTLGKVHVDLVSSKLIQFGNDGEACFELVLENFDRDFLFTSQLSGLLAMLDLNVQPPVNLESGLDSLVVSEAILKSIQYRAIVDIEEFIHDF